VTWVLTNKPIGSMAQLVPSPLGTNVPTYKPADQVAFQVAGRMMLRPDVAGQYSVVATITTMSSGTTNITSNISAGTYVGANTCALCHSGGVLADNTWVPWSQTPHATFFTRAIDGKESDHYGKNCISCHTVGYDANTNAVNGGFDDVAAKLGWTFPPTLTNGNWAAMPHELQNLANIQCENCHGPGSEHASAFGNTNVSNWPRIGVTTGPGDCSQCHDAQPNHIHSAEWNNSRHAIVTRDPSGAGRESCVGCHTANGFAGRMSGSTNINTTYEAITCAACHDPHDASKPSQLRSSGPVTLMDGTVVTADRVGKGILCMECHHSRANATNYVEITPGSTRFGPHHGPEADMLLGVNGITYGKTIPSSAHRDAVGDTCVHCHMQNDASTNATYLHAGGHTFSMSYDTGTNTIDHVDACVQCHGPMESFAMYRQDYDGNGVIDDVQTEVKGLLNRLGLLLPPVGVPKNSLNITTNWTKPQLRAAYNYQFVLEDKSFGIHNVSYAVGLLKASIADLNGDGNNDGLPDAWQTQYFGDPNSTNAAPGACPAGDGIPNWLKYSLGIDPTVPGGVVPGGVVWANGKTLGNPGGTNDIAIYTAAEVAFNTEVGKTYQIQAVSALSEGWQNVGTPVQGTGSVVSFVTPTRQNVQQFYRVVPSP
jgi:hypothetical protein